MKLLKFTKKFFSEKAIFVLFVVATLIYSIAAIIRHSHFESFAFDLGIYDQAIWLYSKFKIPYSTIKEMIIIGDHFTPSLALLAPLYWLVNDVKILLFAQAFIVSLGALPLFLIGRKLLKNKFLSLSIAFAYLFYFGIQNALLFDFHEIVIITGLLPWLFYFIIEKKWKAYFILALIILGLKEDAPIILGSIGLFLLTRKGNIKIGITTIIISAISFFIITRYIIPQLNPGGFIYQPDLPKSLSDWWLAMTYPPIKIRTAIISFLPFAFLPLFSFGALIPIIFHFIEHYPGSTLVGRWDIYLHYRAPLAAMMAFATILSIQNLNNLIKTRNKQLLNNAISIIILASTFFTQIYLHLPLNSLFKKQFYYDNSSQKNINTLIAKIPKDATLSTQNNIAPHVSHREKIYLFPKGKNVEYVLLDLKENQPPNNFFNSVGYNLRFTKVDVFNLLKRNKYYIFDKKGEVVLLKKGK